MTPLSQVSHDQVASLEAVEREAMTDFCASASSSVVETLGLEYRRIDDGLLMIWRKPGHIFFNRLLALGTERPVRSAAIDDAIAAYGAVGVRNWTVSMVPGAESIERIVAERGFSRHPRTWVKFLHESGRPPAARTDLALREVGSNHAQGFGTVAARAFGMPDEAVPWLAAIVGRPRWRVFAGFDGEIPVTVGAVFIDGDLAWLAFGATLASHRGRGGQSAVLAARIEAAREVGATLISTETGIPHPGEAGPSYNNIQRAGFRISYERPNFYRPEKPA